MSNFRQDWNEHWFLESDLGPATWLKEDGDEAWERWETDRPGQVSSVAVVTSFHFESYLALPHSSQPAEDYGITGHEYLNDDVSARLASVFMNHTDPPRDCWTALWVGYGDNPEPVLTAQQIEIGPRECVLARGSLDFVTGRGDEHGIWPVRERSPDFWWGTGERWLVSSDTDLDATYIACSSDCCGELLEMGINGLTAVPPDHPTIGPEPRD